MVERNVRGQLGALLSAFDDILSLGNTDALLRRSVEVARKRIGLRRAAIFLYDGARDMMLGTWGTDLHGAIVDEHQIMYTLSDIDREALRRAKEGGVPFSVFEDCPIVEHHGSKTRVAGRGWGAWTPILSPRGIIGMMFNDAGLSGAPVDEIKQAHAAIVCSLLGTILDPARRMPGAGKGGFGGIHARRMVTTAIPMLDADPTVEAQEIAQRMGIAVVRFTRNFRAEMGISLREYRNRVRLKRVDALLEQGRSTLRDAARAAGFGSYAQFYRVFRGIRDTTPREFLHRRSRHGSAPL